MKKYLGIAFLILLLSVLVSVKHQQYADNPAPDGGKQSLPVSSGNAPATKDDSQKPEGTLHPWFELAYVIIGWPNGITVWALLLTMAVIAEQTIETRRAAQATASSATSFINKERSRLFISHEITPDFVVTVRATNRGLSPARVTYKYVSSEFYKPTEEFRPEVPRDVEIGEPPENHICNEWVLPGKATLVGECDDSFISRRENPDLYREIMDGEMIVWYFGIIRWIDSVTEDEQWIRFCYRCYPFKGGNYLSEGGPPAYRGSSDEKSKNPN